MSASAAETPCSPFFREERAVSAPPREAPTPSEPFAARVMLRIFYTAVGLCAWSVVDESAFRLMQLGAFTADLQAVLDDKLLDERVARERCSLLSPMDSRSLFPLMRAAQEAGELSHSFRLLSLRGEGAARDESSDESSVGLGEGRVARRL